MGAIQLAVGSAGLGSSLDQSGVGFLVNRNGFRIFYEPLRITAATASIGQQRAERLILSWSGHERLDMRERQRVLHSRGEIQRPALNHLVVPAERAHAFADVFHGRNRTAAIDGRGC